MSDFTGIGEINNEANISVYPNPFINEINVKVDESSPVNIVLCDALGRIIKTTTGVNILIDTKVLPNGVYFLNITSKDGTSTTKKVVE